jgi:hypothetical protein
MARNGDPAALRFARMEGALTGVRDVIRLAAGTGREEAAREQWPELWARLDQVLAVLEERPGRG